MLIYNIQYIHILEVKTEDLVAYNFKFKQDY